MQTSSADVHSNLAIPMCVCDHKAFTRCGFSVINDDLLLQLTLMCFFSETFLSKNGIMHIITLRISIFFLAREASISNFQKPYMK